MTSTDDTHTAHTDGTTKTYSVVAAYRTRFHNPIRLSRGEGVLVGDRDTEYAGWTWITTEDGNSGWAPQQLLEQRDDGAAIATNDYDATELDTELGESLTLLQELNEWGYVERCNGDHGWVPMKTIEASSVI